MTASSWADRWVNVSAAAFRDEIPLPAVLPPRPPQVRPSKPPESPRRPGQHKPRKPLASDAAFARRETEIAVGAARGFRWWTLPVAGIWGDSDAAPVPRLHGIRGAWHPGVNTAECLAGDYAIGPGHAVPAEGCGCGFWAYWELHDYHGVAGPGEILVGGVIEGWGRTLIGEQGFRCAQARVAGLFVPPELLPGAYPGAGEMMSGLIVKTDAGLATSWELPPESAAEQAIAEAERAVIADWLALAYPQARMCASREELCRAFPPDQRYG